ncbi:MAG: hypothetical protein AAGF20_02250 [Pseudomonadota bacterium]
MSEQEQALADQKMRAEIAKLIAETSSINVEMSKMRAETMKLNTENRWYLLIVGAAFATAMLALGRLMA